MSPREREVTYKRVNTANYTHEYIKQRYALSRFEKMERREVNGRKKLSRFTVTCATPVLDPALASQTLCIQ